MQPSTIDKVCPMGYVWAALGVAFVLWTLMFSPWTAPLFPFWTMMSISAVCLIAIALVAHRGRMHLLPANITIAHIIGDIALGIGIAVVLWGVFWVGDKLSQWIFPSFARSQVDRIYGMKDGENPWVISLLLLCLIGPAEEIFWRGMVQRRMMQWASERYDAASRFTWQVFVAVVVAVLAYALVHIFSLNFMLIMSALVCGALWGGLYWLLPRHFLAILLSHALWDAAVFVWFPIL